MVYTLLWLVASLVGCSPMGNSIDKSSYANIEQAWTSHLDLQLEVNFD